MIDDIIWYNESSQRPDALVRFDPKTEKFQSWAIPSGVGIIRHMRKTPDGNLAIHQTSTNRIGLAIIGKAATRHGQPLINHRNVVLVGTGPNAVTDFRSAPSARAPSFGRKSTARDNLRLKAEATGAAATGAEAWGAPASTVSDREHSGTGS